MMLEYAYWITQALLAIGALCVVYRVFRGPSVLDRIISCDVMLIIVGSVMLAHMARYEHQDYIMFVVITAVIGFLGAVAIARFAVSGAVTPSAHNREREEAKHAAGLAGELASEPESPAYVYSPNGDSSDASSAPEEHESTSWFTNLAQSGFRPNPRKRSNGEDQAAQEKGEH